MLSDNKALYDFFTKHGLQDNQLIADIQNALLPVALDKKTIIFRQNQRAQSRFFLPKGIIRYYICDHKGREHTKSFRVGPTFLGSAYVTHSKSHYPFTAEVVKAETLYALDIKFWQSLIEKNYSFMRFYNQYMTSLFMEKEKRELSFLQHSAFDRYSQFQTEYKEYVSFIPKWMIASFLGITPEALSRIIKRSR